MMPLPFSAAPLATAAPFLAALSAALNHLLEPEQQARARLKNHAGKVVCFDIGAVQIRLCAQADGLVSAAASDVVPNVTIRIKPADLPLILQNRDRAFSYVTIDGDADFANAISQVSQSVSWDAEGDLSRLVGDIAAVRLVAGAKSIAGAAATSQRKLFETTAEYFLEENPMLMRRQPVRDFAADVARLRDDVERMAKRIDRLKARVQ